MRRLELMVGGWGSLILGKLFMEFANARWESIFGMLMVISAAIAFSMVIFGGEDK